MQLNAWLKIYRLIAKRLPLGETKDGAATVIISSLLERRPTLSLDDLKGKIIGREGRWQSMDIFNLASSKSEIPNLETSSRQTLTGY